MKNQYFGDTRDLFKYDLALEIITKSNEVKHLTLIPMLTMNKLENSGRMINHNGARAGKGRVELKEFLQDCLCGNRKNINELERFFSEAEIAKNLTITIYRKGEHFSHDIRDAYFSKVENRLLTRSLILVDPDVGLEVKSIKGKEEGYIMYPEVRMLYDRMDLSSILMIFQFIPRVKRRQFFNKIAKRLRNSVTSSQSVWYISDNQIVFFILTNSWESSNFVEKVLEKYAKYYNLLWGRG